MKRSLSFFVIGFLTLWTGAAWADTPDGQTPSEETVCDAQTGAAYGLCTAYCEAMDCDSTAPQASPTACTRVKNNYQRITGQPLPCNVPCPCLSLPLFSAIVNGTAIPDRCIVDASTISVLLPDGTFAFIDSAASPAFCSDNLQSFVNNLTAAEANVCRDVLRRAAMNRVACVPPE